MSQESQQQELRLPAGFDPVNLEIMNLMEDSTLLSFCLTDKRGVALCNDEVFWRNRAAANYALLLQYKEVAETWYQFYRRVYYDAYYVLMIGDAERNYLYTDINLAYQKLLRLLQLLETLPVENMTLEQLMAFDFDSHEFLEGNMYHIMVVFKNRTITVGDESSEIIFEVSDSARGRYLNPNLLSYPVLNPSGPLVSLLTYGEDGVKDYTFLPLTTDTLLDIHNVLRNQAAYIIIPDSGEQDDTLEVSKYGFVMSRKDVVLALLNPALYSSEFKSEFFAFVAPRDYRKDNETEARYTQQLITTPGAAYQLRDIASLLMDWPWK